MSIWTTLPDGTRVLTPKAIRQHMRDLLRAGFTLTQARLVVKPWADSKDLTLALAELADEIDGHTRH